MGTDLLDKVVLLCLTAAITGFLVPFILKRIEERKTVEQKNREAELTRQAKLIQAQSTFLDTVSTLLWRWRYSSMRVTYYGSYDANQRYEEAVKSHDDSLWATISDLRQQICLSRWLVSDKIYGKLLAMYLDMVNTDRRLAAATLMKDEARRSTELREINAHIFDNITPAIDRVLNEIAVEVGLDSKAQTDRTDQQPV